MMRDRDLAPGGVAGEPFASAEDAWFWTCAALLARQQGVRRGKSSLTRPCDPDDVILCVERLLRTALLGDHHARVIGRWGRQGICPMPQYGGGNDQRPWAEAMMMLGTALAKKGIVRRDTNREIVLDLGAS